MTDRYAVVVGGANVDLVGASTAPMVLGTSNPGLMHVKPGGVGRNVAENIARLGSPVHLVAGIGDDPMGRLVTQATREAGVGLDHVLPAVATGTYTALLDDAGELMAAVSDMRASDDLAPCDLAPAAPLLADAAVVVLDANLAADTLREATRLARLGSAVVVVEPVSVPKAERLRPLLAAGVDWFAISPNTDELRALTGLDDLEAAVAHLHANGVEWVWVRHGRAGSTVHHRHASGTRNLPDADATGPVHLPAHAARVLDVTGAGDSMLGAFVHGLLSGTDVVEAARWGHAAAKLTVESTSTVRPDLTHDLLTATLDSPTLDSAPSHSERNTL